MTPRVEFDEGRIILHSDGPWQAMTEYEFAAFMGSVAAVWQAVIMWRRYPPADPGRGIIPNGPEV